MTYTCLVLIGLGRLLLVFFPLWFHAINHRLVSYVLISFILSCPGILLTFQAICCGHVCDVSVKVIVSGLYGRAIEDQLCATPFVLTFVIQALAFIYMVILVLEYRQHRRAVAPTFQVLIPRDGRTNLGEVSRHLSPLYAGLYACTASTCILIPTVSRQVENGLRVQPKRAWESNQMTCPSSTGAPPILSKLILKTGGVTFLAFLAMAVFWLAILKGELSWAVSLFLKLGCLMTHLAWYWVSVDDHIRVITDAKFLSVIPQTRWLKYLGLNRAA